jgi:hypothetical protein
MKKNIIVLFLTAVLLCKNAAADTKTISLILPSSPGGIYDTQLRALEKNLKSHAYNVNYEIVGSCKGAAAWLQANSKTPAIYMAMSEDEIHRRNHSESEGACDTKISQDRFIAIGVVSRQNVCSMLPAEEAMQQWKKGNFIVGTTTVPVNNYYLITDLLESFNLKAKVIKYQGNPKLVQALISKDIDFAFFGNVRPALDAGAQCFITLGGKNFAKETNRISLSELNPNTKYNDYQAINIYMGQNIDHVLMRSLVTETLKNDETIKKEINSGYRLLLELNMDQQWQYVQNQIHNYSK